MKSYKDINKSIVMNAPEGAMWVACWRGSPIYYKCGSTTDVILLYADGGKWVTSARDGLVEVQTTEYFIPLPNIEIPWEATEDSVCPVAEGANIIVKEVCGYTRQIKVNSNNIYWNTKPFTGNQIASYKIIDEEYLPLKEDEHLKEQEDDPAIEALVEYLSKEEQKAQLIKDLEFLQILANKFPEIKDKVMAEMRIQFECYCEEYLNDQDDH